MTIAYLLSDELMFTSRITGTAKDVGFMIKAVRTTDALLTSAHDQPPKCVIVDLSNPTLKINEFISSLRSLPAMPRVVAYGSHVDTATLQAARSAGCDVVLPRSQFVEKLASELPNWLS